MSSVLPSPVAPKSFTFASSLCSLKYWVPSAVTSQTSFVSFHLRNTSEEVPLSTLKEPFKVGTPDVFAFTVIVESLTESVFEFTVVVVP